MELDSSAKMSNPDFQAVGAIGSAQKIVTSVLDHETDVVVLCELDGVLDVRYAGSSDDVDGVVAEGALAGGLLTSGGIDRWAGNFSWIAQSVWLIGLEGSIAPLLVNESALRLVVGLAWIARFSDWHTCKQVAIDRLVKAGPLML